MSNEKFRLFVFCKTGASANSWAAISRFYHDLDISPLVTHSPVDALRQIASQAVQPFLVCRDDVWLGRGLSAHAATLVEELNQRFPNWGLCGNRGVRWDGQRVYDFTYDMGGGGLQGAVCAYPVICLDDDLLLVNPSAVRSHKDVAPAIARRRVGVLLSLECLRNGSLMAVSPRLLCMRSVAQEDAEPALDTDAMFREYYRAAFVNHRFPTPDGMQELSEIIDYRYVSEPWTTVPQEDVLDLYDRSLAASQQVRRPSITICCRTQFRRPEMLERAVGSFAVCRQEMSRLAEVEVRLITDADRDLAEPAVERLRQIHPGAALQCWHHEIRSNRSSRMDLLLAAVERAGTDYIWFIDDDDFANPSAAQAVARSLVAGAALLLVASSAVLRETWMSRKGRREGDVAAGFSSEWVDSERTSCHYAENVFRVLRGTNFVPICSMILPVVLMKERIAKIDALGDYNEDYFLLLLALTAPRIDLCVLNCEIASISIRGDENTVAQKDQAGWNVSLATFLLEVLNNSEGNSPFLWQLANSPRW
jgi:hypothetical protein